MPNTNRSHRPRETDLYARVAAWLKRSYGCFVTAKEIGLRGSRVDVVGVRDVGGDLSGQTETIAVEVKNGRQPFATTAGQARGYAVYAHRVYLAEWRSEGFSRDERDIAACLGVGLIEITARHVREVLASPAHLPIERMQLSVFERMGYGPCCLCGCIFRVGNGEVRYDFRHLSKAGIAKAAEREKGLIFWNYSVGERKFGERTRENGPFERRFMCEDCVWILAQPRAR